MDRNARKRIIEDGLAARDFGGLLSEGLPSGRLLRQLVQFLQRPDALLRWRAVEALGRVAAVLPPSDPSLAETLRGLFWMMNDESGNLCRMAPEAIGEILSARPDLRPAFSPLLPQFLHEEPFEPGCLWALCRLISSGGAEPEGVDPEDLALSLSHEDPRRRGLARRFCRMTRRPAPPAPPVVFEDYDPEAGEVISTREE
ncbi:MAG: DVU0298 family protein [Acidobacteriota bacterium]